MMIESPTCFHQVLEREPRDLRRCQRRGKNCQRLPGSSDRSANSRVVVHLPFDLTSSGLFVGVRGMMSLVGAEGEVIAPENYCGGS